MTRLLGLSGSLRKDSANTKLVHEAARLFAPESFEMGNINLPLYDGDAGYNQELSENRANAVADVLLNSGIPFSRIQTFGRGESQPVADNFTPEGKAQNRRVEIVILPTAA